MTLLKKILKRKHIIAQSVCNRPKLEYYYQANNPKRKNGHMMLLKVGCLKKKKLLNVLK